MGFIPPGIFLDLGRDPAYSLDMAWRDNRQSITIRVSVCPQDRIAFNAISRYPNHDPNMWAPPSHALHDLVLIYSPGQGLCGPKRLGRVTRKIF